MFGEVPGWLVDWGTAAGYIAAVIILLGLIGKSPLGRWLWQHIVYRPATEWLRHTIAGELDPAKKELTDTVAGLRSDLLDHMHAEERLRSSDMAARVERQDIHDEERDLAEKRFVKLEDGQHLILDRVTTTLRDLSSGNPEMRPRTARTRKTDPPPKDPT